MAISNIISSPIPGRNVPLSEANLEVFRRTLQAEDSLRRALSQKETVTESERSPKNENQKSSVFQSIFKDAYERVEAEKFANKNTKYSPKFPERINFLTEEEQRIIKVMGSGDEVLRYIPMDELRRKLEMIQPKGNLFDGRV